MIESRRRNLFLALCALVLLHTGVHLSQSFVNYPGWYVLEAESFKAYHWPMSMRAGIFGAAPRLLELVLALVVLRFPPQGVPRWILFSRHCPRHWRPLVNGSHLTSDPCPARYSRQYTGARVAPYSHRLDPEPPRVGSDGSLCVGVVASNRSKPERETGNLRQDTLSTWRSHAV
jgi:hypothetical protein